jgi:hypothetical protein
VANFYTFNIGDGVERAWFSIKGNPGPARGFDWAADATQSAMQAKVKVRKNAVAPILSGPQRKR